MKETASPETTISPNFLNARDEKHLNSQESFTVIFLHITNLQLTFDNKQTKIWKKSIKLLNRFENIFENWEIAHYEIFLIFL